MNQIPDFQNPKSPITHRKSPITHRKSPIAQSSDYPITGSPDLPMASPGRCQGGLDPETRAGISPDQLRPRTISASFAARFGSSGRPAVLLS